jgi:5-methylcytosine-specific restriction endonuclease McrA
MDREKKLAQKRDHYQRHKVEILCKQKERYASVDGEVKRARVNAYRLANVETVRAKKAAYCAANKEKIAEKKRSDYLANRDAILASHRANPQIKAYMKAYRKENAEKLREQNTAWRLRNPERYEAMRQAWRDEHKAERAHQEGQRRVRKKGNGGSHTFAEWVAKCETFSWRCVYCDSGAQMTRDHDVPISRGGSDNIDNIVPACGSCNSSKGARTGAEFQLRLLKAA